MQSHELSFMPKFMQEIPYSKSFIKDYQRNGATQLIGLGDMHLFSLYVNFDSWPAMRWKKSSVDTNLLSSNYKTSPQFVFGKKTSTSNFYDRRVP